MVEGSYVKRGRRRRQMRKSGRGGRQENTRRTRLGGGRERETE